MEKKALSGKSVMHLSITILAPLFPVGVLLIFSRIAQAGAVCIISLALLVLTVWAWTGLLRSGKPGAIRTVGMVTGGVGAILCLVIVVSAWMLFRTMM